MKCRKCIKDKDYNPDNYNIVQYGSYGLQNPYAIIFKINENDPMSEEVEIKNGIIINKCPFNLTLGNEVIVTITNIDLENKIITYSNLTENGFKIIACYYNKEMYDEKKDTNITKEIILTTNKIKSSFEILMMAKRWKDDLSSYAEKQEGTASSLIQRLSVIQGELWYKINYGLPLFQNIRDKGIMDSVIIDIILSHPDVASIQRFSSSISKSGIYTFEGANIITIFNETIELTKVMG